MREIVLDTNVLVAGLRSKRGASYQLLRSIGSGAFRLNISVALALEYEDVLKRKDMLRGGMAAESIDDFLDYLFTTANLVPSVLRRRPALRDPDDERILESAVQCRAMIVTHNTKHLCGTARSSDKDTRGIPENVEGRPMNVNVSVPDELYQKAVEIAEAQHVSVDEVFASAFVEQLAAWERLKQRAARGSRESFLAALDKVPDVEPEDYDRL